MMRLLLLLAFVASALSRDLDCSEATCRSACECSTEKCHSLIDECLNDPGCSLARECGMKCGCSDTGCLARCASVNGSLKSLEVSQCVVENCVASRSGQLPECSDATCPSVCECTLDKCALPAINCQFNAACREFAECSFTCGCGDTACATACAEQHDSTQTVKLYECLVDKCDAKRDVQLPDCNTAECPSICECTLEQCALPAINCQFNAACRDFAECSLTCPCGDTSCATACAEQHDSTQTVKLYECLVDKCDAKRDVQLPDCNTAECPSICECTLEQCALPAINCQFNAACMDFAECSLTCPCGDTACATACAEQHDSTQTVKLYECLVDKCDAKRDVQLPDCNTAECSSICECTLEQCALPAINCQFNAACRDFAECSLTCPCGDTACATACAEEHDSTQTAKLYECLVDKCDAKRDVQLPDCSIATCPSVCECSLEKCALPALNCQFNAACREFAECSLTCTCGDTACAEACAEEHDSKQTVNMLECLVEKCDARREVESLPDSSATRDLQVPDCNEAGCSSVCNCAVESCTLPALNCNFNPVCKQFAECAFQCPCEDFACLDACEAEHHSRPSEKLRDCLVTCAEKDVLV